MKNLGLMLARFLLAAWCGAATLYVATSVREQVSEKFDAATKDELALVRFPAYYAFGFVMVGVALLGLIVGSNSQLSRRKQGWCIGFVVIALVLMVVDYTLIYVPLVDILNPVGQAREGEFLETFTEYHNASKHINMASVGLCLIAAFLASFPNSNADLDLSPTA